MAQEKTGEDGLQGFFALIGISLGVVPLVRVLFFGGEVGRLVAWIPGTDDAPGEWLLPAAVLVVCLTAIGLLERVKLRR